MCNVYIFPNPPKPSFVIRSSSHSPFNHLQGPASLWDLSSLTYSLGSSQRGCLTELPKHTAACSHLTVFALVFSLPKALFIQISLFSLSLSLSQTYIFYFLSLLSSKGRSLRCSPGQGNPRGCVVTLYGSWVWEGTVLLALLSASFQSLPHLPTIKLGPSGADSQVGGFVYVLGPCGSLQRTLLWGWEFLLLPPQPPQEFSIRGLRLYFPVLGLWVVWSISLSSCSSQFICIRMWDCLVCNPPPCTVHHLPPCCKSSPPSCPSLPLLPVWMNVSSLTLWLSDFHAVRFFWHFWLFIDFRLVVILLLLVRGGTVCLPKPPSWPEATVCTLLRLASSYY